MGQGLLDYRLSFEFRTPAPWRHTRKFARRRLQRGWKILARGTAPRPGRGITERTLLIAFYSVMRRAAALNSPGMQKGARCVGKTPRCAISAS